MTSPKKIRDINAKSQWSIIPMKGDNPEQYLERKLSSIPAEAVQLAIASMTPKFIQTSQDAKMNDHAE